MTADGKRGSGSGRGGARGGGKGGGSGSRSEGEGRSRSRGGSRKGDRLTHLDEEGRPRMVDVAEKPVTARHALAEGAIRMRRETLEAIREGRSPKGDPLQVAQVAGIMGGKKAGELLPLCHILPATSVGVELVLDPELPGVRATAAARVAGTTGVEMEALTAVAVALLTVYDMVKAIDRGMVMEEIRLLRKEGGRSGIWEVDAPES